MDITNEERRSIINRIPKLKFSSDKYHKKISGDIYYIIPKGKKILLWFSYYKSKRVCYSIELRSQGFSTIKTIPIEFNKQLALGTIFYGTLFYYKQNAFFSIENIHYYKGESIEHYDENKKLQTINSILKNEITQTSQQERNKINIGVPIIKTNFTDAFQIAKTSCYTVYSIQSRYMNKTHNCYNSLLFNKNHNETSIKYVFNVKPCIKNDIYELHCFTNMGLQYYDLAYIPDYKTSVYMNKLFRDIKENKNLDALEESDDEEEFENINEDKFVNMNKNINMECIYNHKFKKFVPITISKSKSIIHKKNIQII